MKLSQMHFTREYRDFSLVTLGNFFFFCNFSSFFLLPLFIRDIGGDEAQIGYVMGTFGVTSIGAIPFAAFLIDRYGRRRFMLAGSSLMIVASLLYVFISDISVKIFVFETCAGSGFLFFLHFRGDCGLRLHSKEYQSLRTWSFRRLHNSFLFDRTFFGRTCNREIRLFHFLSLHFQFRCDRFYSLFFLARGKFYRIWKICLQRVFRSRFFPKISSAFTDQSYNRRGTWVDA